MNQFDLRKEDLSMEANSNTNKTISNAQLKEMGYWDSTMEYLSTIDSSFYTIYKDFLLTPYTNNIFDAKTIELIHIAINASPTNLCQSKLEMHIKNAIIHGATIEEIFEVLKLVSVLGMHTCAVGIPILEDEYNAYSNHSMSVCLNEKQTEQKNQFIKKMGYWNRFRDILLVNDGQFFESYLKYLTNPWEKDIISEKLKEFIYIAIDSSTTHLFEKGLRIHIRNALKYGATFEEIMEIFKIVSTQGSSTFHISLPILEEAISEI